MENKRELYSCMKNHRELKMDTTDRELGTM